MTDKAEFHACVCVVYRRVHPVVGISLVVAVLASELIFVVVNTEFVDEAPELEMRSHHGSRVCLPAELRGGYVVRAFFVDEYIEAVIGIAIGELGRDKAPTVKP